MLALKPLLKPKHRFKTDENGQIGVWFAILVLPLLLTTTFVLDYKHAEKIKLELTNAVDEAAIAAVLHQSLTVDERAVFAETYFWENFKYRENFTLNVVDASAERVELKAEGSVPTSIMRATGKDSLDISQSAISELTKEDVICVLALDPDGQNAFEVTEGASFRAPTCSVQVNSSHDKAAFVESSSSASAKSFCTAGGASGAFKPFANTECSLVQDPYENLQAPPSAPCLNRKGLKLNGKGNNASKSGIKLAPGVYCGGLTVSGLDITFMKGQYIISDGPLIFTKESSATAHDVTFIMRGKRATLDIKKGSKLDVIAAKTGPLAGLAFYQDKSSITSKNPKLPNGTNNLSGASEMKITGTVYFPTQEVIIDGGSGFGTQAPATSFIGYRVSFKDGSQITVKSDHQSAGLPPLLPRSDAAARLIE